MKKGFTLLELIVVLIIIGILATLGLSRFGGMMEKARGAEARAILGDMRKLASAFYMEKSMQGQTATIPDEALSLGTTADSIPSSCRSTHYFYYDATCGNSNCQFIAERCTGNSGKNPPAASAGNITLTSNLATGNDNWGGTGQY